jgi:hypothetical protein
VPNILDEYMRVFQDDEAEQSKEDFIEEQGGELKWHEALAVSLLLLDKPAKVAEIAALPPILAKAKKQQRTTSIRPTIWGILQQFTPSNCEHVKIALRREPSLFWKDADSGTNRSGSRSRTASAGGPYLMRCQLVHGAATHGGKLNRTSLRHCVM